MVLYLLLVLTMVRLPPLESGVNTKPTDSGDAVVHEAPVNR